MSGYSIDIPKYSRLVAVSHGVLYMSHLVVERPQAGRLWTCAHLDPVKDHIISHLLYIKIHSKAKSTTLSKVKSS